MATSTSRPWLRSPTLRVVDLLSTRVQSVRVELVGTEASSFARAGAMLIYVPLFVVGYLLILTALMRLLAAVLGWGLTLVLFGAVHLAVSAWGLVRGPRSLPPTTTTYPVLDPELAVAPPLSAVALPGHSSAQSPDDEAPLIAQGSSL